MTPIAHATPWIVRPGDGCPSSTSEYRRCMTSNGEESESRAELRWPNHPAAHALEANLFGYEDSIEEARDLFVEAEDDGAVERLDEALALITITRTILATTATALVVDQDFSTIDSSLSAAAQHAPSASTSPTFDNQIKALRLALRPLAALVGRDDRTALPVMSAAHDRIRDAAADAEAKQLSVHRAAEEASASSEAAKEAEERAKLSELETASVLERKEAEITRVVSDLKAAVVDAALESQRVRETTLDQRLSQLVEEAQGDLGEIRRRRGLAADAVLSGGYEAEAQKEFTAADSADTSAKRWAGFASFLAVVAVILTVWIATWESIDWQAQISVTLAKFAAVGVIFGIANHHARQARRHRQEGRRLRKLRLELETIGEYLLDMEADDRAGVRSSLVGRFFSDFSTQDSIDGDSFTSPLSVASRRASDGKEPS